jgi:iron complex transport system substrate-binding protein
MRTPRLVAVVLVVLAAVAPAAAAGPAATGATPATTGQQFSQEQCTFPVTVTDASGTEVTVDAEPERVVSLSPSAAQTMWEIGAREKVVGVTQFAAYLDGADERVNVSGPGQTPVSTEKVVGADPDLVLAPNVVSDETVRKLRESGLTVYKASFATSLEDVVEKTRTIGRLVGACEGATERVTAMESELDRIERAVEGEDRPRVLYTSFGFTAGEGTFIDELITTAGGRNVAAESGITGYKEISPETVVQQDPEWIVLNEDQPTVPETDAYNATTAVQEGNTVVLDRNYLSQPAPRIMQPLRKLARTFHPEAYAAANATGTPTPETRAESPTAGSPTTTETATGQTATTPESPGATGTDSPGLGFGVVVATLLLWSLVLVRYADGAARRP